MLNRLKPKSEFGFNVLTLMTGTTISQAIPIAISPILTRIYSPDDFGVFALYMSIVSILSVVVTGKYELAIILPKNDKDAINIVALSILISFFISCIFFLIVLIFNVQITNLLGNPEISKWLFMIPFSILLIGIFQSLNYWFNRKKHYKNLSISRITQSTTTAGTNLSMGINNFRSAGLIFSSIVGQGVATSILTYLIYKNYFNLLLTIKKTRVILLAKRYIKFPKFLILAHGMNTLSGQLPVILFSSLFNGTVVGFYMIIQRVVGLPMSIIASSISDVFRQEASVEYIKNGNCKHNFVSTFKKLMLIAIVPFIVFYFISPELFSFVFGEKWKIAGEYAQIMTPMFFLQFVTSPLSSMFMIAEKQKLDLYWQIFLLIMVLASITIGNYLFHDIKKVLILFTLAYSIAYSVNIFITYKFSKGII